MPRRPRTIPGPSRLSGILANLTRAPRPHLLPSLKALKLTLAARNDHFGARHFMKEELPRIRYANPVIDISVSKVLKTVAETWNPELVVEYRDGTSKTLNLASKWSTAIFQELMDTAGSATWARWKRDRAAAGLPVLDPPKATTKPDLKTSRVPKTRAEPTILSEPDRPKTGAAAMLPM